VKLGDLADVIRSKNSGIHYVTIDVMFAEQSTYEAVKASSTLNVETIAARYHLAEEDVRLFEYDSGRAFKITIPRSTPVGSPGDPDLYGAQQHAPIFDLELSIEPP